jgi:RND family efflux transporter, MFP subunit
MDEHLQKKYRDEADAANRQKRMSSRSGLLILVVVVVVAAAIAVIGIVSRIHTAHQTAQDTNDSASPTVVAARPQNGAAIADVVLPGNIYAYTDSPIFAHTDGYLQKWYFDIGAHVRKGQLLAVISNPELDQQVAQAGADVQTAQTNAQNAETTAQRYKELLPSAAVSKQDTDTAAAQASSGQSTVQSAKANLQRLQSLQTYERIYAPFDGYVTARNVDIGQLISSGSGGGQASQLFHMAAVQMLRVYVAVPQMYGDVAKPGAPAFLSFNEYPGETFPVRVTRSSGYVDPSSRTLLVELDYNNARDQLMPGSFAQVHFHLQNPTRSIVVPASALLFRAEGTRIATVGGTRGEQRAHLQPVVVGQDDGKMLQIVSGLTDAAAVIQNPPDSLIDGEQVNVVDPQQTTQTPPEQGAHL